MIDEVLWLSLLTVSFYVFFKWATANNDYFKKRNIKYLKPTFLIGNNWPMYSNKYTVTEHFGQLYKNFPNERIYGTFDNRKPVFIVRDPEMVKKMSVKDFDHFEDHRGFGGQSGNLLGDSLIFLRGERWRNMRSTLSPAFTGSKMRQMFALISECANDVCSQYLIKSKNGEKLNIEFKDFYTRYTNDVIASCAFGLKVNSIVEPNNEFFVNGKAFVESRGFSQFMKMIFIMIMPKVAKMLKMEIFDPAIGRTFKSIIMDTMKVRKEKNIFRPDMVQILMQVREGSLKHTNEKVNDDHEGFATVKESAVGHRSVQIHWNDDELIAQCLLFFLAGFDVVSNALLFASYELLANPDIQQKLYEEISDVNEKLNGQAIDYDTLQKMKYMDQVVCETLRKWPSTILLDRLCTKDYLYDDGENRFIVEKGTPFLIPTYGFHHDPKYYPNPEAFNPERFNDQNKGEIHAGTYTPFGIGPRNCIGSRFALMEIKAMLYHLLLHFSFEANAETQIPIKLKKLQAGLSVENGIHLELRPRV